LRIFPQFNPFFKLKKENIGSVEKLYIQSKKGDPKI